MGYIGAVIAIIGMVLTIFTLFKKRESGEKLSPLLWIGIIATIVGAALSLFNI